MRAHDGTAITTDYTDGDRCVNRVVQLGEDGRCAACTESWMLRPDDG